MHLIRVHSFCVFHQAEYLASKHPGLGGLEKIHLPTCAVLIYALLFSSFNFSKQHLYQSLPEAVN